MENKITPLIKTHLTQALLSIFIVGVLLGLIVVWVALIPFFFLAGLGKFYHLISYLIWIPTLVIFSVAMFILSIRACFKRVWNEILQYLGLFLFPISYATRIFLLGSYLAWIPWFTFGCMIMVIIGMSNIPRNVQRRRKKWKRAAPLLTKMSQDVSSFQNGYTTRPYSMATSLEFENFDFSRFCRDYAKFLALNYLIVGRIFHQDSVYLFITNNYKKKFLHLIKDFCLFRGDINRQSWIRILENGEIQIKLSQKDYLEFTRPVSYHEVCSSLGHTLEISIHLFLKNDIYGSLDSLLPEM